MKTSIIVSQYAIEASKAEAHNMWVEAMRHLDAFNAFLASKPEKASALEILRESGVIQKGLKKALKELNTAVAAAYYVTCASVQEVLVKGFVPAYKVQENEEGGLEFVLFDEGARPTCRALEAYVGHDLAARCAALRRCAAYHALSGAEGRSALLTGCKQGEKTVGAPTKKEQEYIPVASEISGGYLKKHLSGLISLLTGEEVVVTSAILKDFESFCVKRTDWGTRSMSSAALGGDLVLEYAHMLLTGKGKFRAHV